MFFKKLFLIIAISGILLIFTVFSDISIAGVNKGLLISANVIVPSLFPFTVFVLFFIKSGITIKNKHINSLINKIFGFNFDIFTVLILSLIGGYPIGAKLIAELYNNKRINKKTANIMLLYCVNAGPAFIISAVGIGIFSSNKIGLILMASHMVSSIIVATIMSKKIKDDNKSLSKSRVLTFSEIFTESVTDAAAAVLQICSYIILFSAITAYFEYFFKNTPILNKIIYFIEVTTGVSKTNNIIFASFLLGFSGISIWFQIFSITKNIGIKYISFIIGRVLHGTISSIITYLCLKIFKISISVFSNDLSFQRENVYHSVPVAVSLFVMVIVLLIYICSKNSSRKMLDDVI